MCTGSNYFSVEFNVSSYDVAMVSTGEATHAYTCYINDQWVPGANRVNKYPLYMSCVRGEDSGLQVPTYMFVVDTSR